MSKKKPSFSLGFQSNSGVNVQGEELVLCKIFCCESGALIASARYGLVSLSVQIWKPFVWLKAPSELRGFTLPVVTWLVRGCTRSSDNRFMHGSNCTWARSGETEFVISRVTTSLYFEFEPKANRNEVFPRNFEYSPSRCFSLFYLQAASQTHAFDAGDTMWRPSSSWVDHKQTARLLRFFVLRRKSTRTQTQLHTLGVEVPSKQKDTKIKLHEMSVVEVDLNLAAAVFPNRTSFFPIPASGARSSADHARPATRWQLVVLVPRSTETHVAKPMAISRNVRQKRKKIANAQAGNRTREPSKTRLMLYHWAPREKRQHQQVRLKFYPEQNFPKREHKCFLLVSQTYMENTR